MKKRFASFLAGLLLFSLAGCAGGDGAASSVGSKETLSVDDLDIRSSYANWSSADDIYRLALNSDKAAHYDALPIYKLDMQTELEKFKADIGASLTLDRGYDEIPSFNEVTAGYDDAFFAENTLLLIYVPANSGAFRFGVDSISCEGDALCVHVAYTRRPESHTDDMAGWFLTIAVRDAMIADYTCFDADLISENN